LAETLRPYRRKKVDNENLKSEYEEFYRQINKSKEKKKKKKSGLKYIKPIPRKTYEKLKIFFLGLFLRYVQIQNDLQKKMEIERGTLSYKRDEVGMKILQKKDDDEVEATTHNKGLKKIPDWLDQKKVKEEEKKRLMREF
jgi:hypothetical protein